MILGLEDFAIIASLVAPLYYGQYQIWKLKSAKKHCVYCQKSNRLFEQEIENI